MARLLVTGVHGFVGRTLAQALQDGDVPGAWTLVDVPESLDLRDPDATSALVERAAPDAVIHLAAQSNVSEALRAPETTLGINLFGTLHLLQSLTKHGFTGPMVYVGTGDVYGLVPEASLPIAETRLPAPRNPYAVSKLAAEALCFQWSVAHGLRIVLARPFNHIGPGQSDAFVVPAFARQLVEIRRGRQPPIVDAGDIDVTRDFTDVRDVVQAYFALLERGTPGEVYNVCSGHEYRVRDLLERLIAIAGVDVTVRQDATRMRPSEQRRVRGDSRRIEARTGWRATREIDRTLTAVLDDWKTRLDG